MGDIKQYLADRALGWHYINNTLVPVDDAMVLPPLVRYLTVKAENLDKSQRAGKT